MQRVRRRWRNVGVAHRRREPLVGDRRVIVSVDQVVRDAGMVLALFELRFQDRRALHRPRDCLVGRRLGRDQVNRREDLRLVVRIFLRQLFECVGQRAHARRVRPFAEFVVIGGDGFDIAAFALGLGAGRARLFYCLLGFLRAVRRGPGCVGVADRQRRDAPAGDRAAGVLRQHLAKRLVALAPPERMQQRHRALQLRLHRRRAGIGERHAAELFGRVSGNGRCGQDR